MNKITLAVFAFLFSSLLHGCGPDSYETNNIKTYRNDTQERQENQPQSPIDRQSNHQQENYGQQQNYDQQQNFGYPTKSNDDNNKPPSSNQNDNPSYSGYTAENGYPGYVSHDGSNTPVSEELDTMLNDGVSFDLPEGWKWLPYTYHDAVLEKPSKNGNSPFVKLEAFTVTDGNIASEKDRIYQDYLDNKKECEKQAQGDCPVMPEFVEFKVDGHQAYASLNSDEYWGKPDWISDVVIEKDGKLVLFGLYDRADLYIPELTVILSSLKW